jgi:hypothetical protein
MTAFTSFLLPSLLGEHSLLSEAHPYVTPYCHAELATASLPHSSACALSYISLHKTVSQKGC